MLKMLFKWRPLNSVVGARIAMVEIETDAQNCKLAIDSTDEDISRLCVLFREAKFLLLSSFQWVVYI